MNLSSTSWIQQPDDSLAVEDLIFPPYEQPRSPVRGLHSTRGTASSLFVRTPHAREPSQSKAYHTTIRYEGTLAGEGRLVRGRTRGDVLADLQRLRGEGNVLVLRRVFLRWGLHAVRQGALRQLHRNTRHALWQRLGGRCFAWWRLLTERRLCREALYEEAALREVAYLRDSVCRVAWLKWWQWARARQRRRDVAIRLSLLNRQRHARLRLSVWMCHPRQRAILRQLLRIRFAAERRLARFFIVTWRLHTLESLVLTPLHVRTAQEVARRAFRSWQRRTVITAGLRRVRREAAWDLAATAFEKWKRWLRRRLQAALLQRANEARHLQRCFTQWAWRRQLDSLDYRRLLR